MNIATISRLDDAGAGNPISGVLKQDETGLGIDFAALLSSVAQENSLPGKALSIQGSTTPPGIPLMTAAQPGGLDNNASQTGALRHGIAILQPGQSQAVPEQTFPSSLAGAIRPNSRLAPDATAKSIGNLHANRTVTGSATLSSVAGQENPALTTSNTERLQHASSETSERVPEASTEAILSAIAQTWPPQTGLPASPPPTAPSGITSEVTPDSEPLRSSQFTLTTLIPSAASRGAVSPLQVGKSGELPAESAPSGPATAPLNSGLFPVDRGSQPKPDGSSANFADALSALSADIQRSETATNDLVKSANNAAAPASGNPLPATATAQHTRDLPSADTPIPSALSDRTAWHQDLGDRIVWMAKGNQQAADISITPANLGPVHISLNIEDGKANAVFASPHAEVRQAIEEALPRLRDMLGTAGISLEQANVGSQMPQQHADNPGRFAAAPRSPGENAILPEDEGMRVQAVAKPIHRGHGLVDLFA